MCVTEQGAGQNKPGHRLLSALQLCRGTTEVMGVLAQYLQASGHRVLGRGTGDLGIVHRNILMCKPVSCALGREAVPATDNVPHRGHPGGQVSVLPEGVCASCSTLHISVLVSAEILLVL